MDLLTGVGKGLLDLLFPPACWICEEEVMAAEGDIHLCEACSLEMSLLPKNKCPGCAKIILKQSGRAALCHECRSGARRFDRAVCVYKYSGAFRKIWHRVKFSGRREWIPAIVEDALTHLSPEDEFNPYLFDVYTWVPTTDRRKAARGFDPAEEIARIMAQKYQRPLSQLLHRIRDSEPQFDLSRQARIQNVEGAFAAAIPAELRTRAALLIDDILTTGSTASACSAVLKSRGIQKVVLFTLSRGA